MLTESYWRKCSSCKKIIPYNTVYWICNVSTCNRKRTGLIFCTVSCWDAHVPGMNHRDSWAEERKSPSREEWEKILSGEAKTPRKHTPKTEVTTPVETPATQPTKVILRKIRNE